MKLSKRQKRVLEQLEQQLVKEMREYFTKTIMKFMQIDDANCIDVKIPCKKYMTNKLETEFNASHNLIISGIINKFVVKWYERIER